MGEFFHGVKTRQVPTSLLPPANVSTALVMAWGCAPIHRLDAEQQAKAKPGNIELLFSNTECAQQFGIDSANDDFDKWTLSEVAFSRFILFGVAPVILVNLFDPEIHNRSISNELVNFDGDFANLRNDDIIGNVALSSSNATFAEGTDYEFNRVKGLLTIKPDSSLAAAVQSNSAINASYKYAAPDMVTSSDCIGGFDIATGKTTGLELVNKAFPQFRMIPNSLIAPKFSTDPSVAAILAAKTQRINGIFTANAFADIPTEGANAVKRYSDVPKYKNDNNLVSENLYLCWPKVKFGDRTIHLSTQAADICAVVDIDNGGIPFGSPSNKSLQCQAAIADGEEVWLGLTEVNYLNANGIATAFNFTNGWVLWGNRTACFPGVTDPKDTFLAHRRMLAWFGNRLILTWIQRVDFPINMRQIQTVVNSEQININSLAAAGAILGGSISFPQEKNNILDVMNGIIVFHVLLGLVAPNESIEFLLEYDPSYIEALFA
jgi:phage tail sheath protein FI